MLLKLVLSGQLQYVAESAIERIIPPRPEDSTNTWAVSIIGSPFAKETRDEPTIEFLKWYVRLKELKQ